MGLKDDINEGLAVAYSNAHSIYNDFLDQKCNDGERDSSMFLQPTTLSYSKDMDRSS
jgi:hypothetical protein